MREAGKFPCPCCGYLVHDEGPGSDQICSVCGWQDDLSQLRFARMPGGANKTSLLEAQAHMQSTGETDRLAERAFGMGVERDHGWRWIDLSIDSFEDPEEGVEYGESYPPDSVSLCYWRDEFWRRD